MITIVTGDTNACKTTYVEKAISGNENADGILSKKRFYGERFDGYYVEHIGSGSCAEFLSLSKPSSSKIGEFFIQQEGLAFAKVMIQNAIVNKKLVVIDELGEAELSERVFHEELSLLLNENADGLIVIRKRLLHSFQEKFPQLAEARIIEVTEGE